MRAEYAYRIAGNNVLPFADVWFDDVFTDLFAEKYF